MGRATSSSEDVEYSLDDFSDAGDDHDNDRHNGEERDQDDPERQHNKPGPPLLGDGSFPWARLRVLIIVRFD